MIQHHPSPETLADYAGGALTEGAALVVACHVAACTVCRDETCLWESAGGVLLESAEPIALDSEALSKALSRLGEKRSAESPKAPSFMRGYEIPAPLGRYRIGARRWATPNVWFAPVESVPLTYLVFARRNTTLSLHTHGGREFTHVLDGAFTDDAGRFERSDFLSTDESIAHAPKATEEGSCLCLISSDAPMLLKHKPAQMLQFLFGTQY